MCTDVIIDLKTNDKSTQHAYPRMQLRVNPQHTKTCNDSNFFYKTVNMSS